MVSGLFVSDDQSNCDRTLLQDMLRHKSNRSGNNPINKCGETTALMRINVAHYVLVRG